MENEKILKELKRQTVIISAILAVVIGMEEEDARQAIMAKMKIELDKL